MEAFVFPEHSEWTREFAKMAKLDRLGIFQIILPLQWSVRVSRSYVGWTPVDHLALGLGATHSIFVLGPGVSDNSVSGWSENSCFLNLQFFETLKDSDQDGKITFEEFAKRYNINLLEDTDRVNAYQVGIH